MSLQLSVRGEQDVYISGKPSITYFSSIYKRATPFVTEYTEYCFDNYLPKSTDTTAIITIPPRGNIVTDICLRNIFSKLYPSSLTGYYYSQISTKSFSAYAITTSGTVILLLQTGITQSYYNTQTILTWTFPQVTDITLTYSGVRLTFSTTNSAYNTLGFKDEDSASFFGFNIVTPTAPSVGAGIIASYKFLPLGYTDNPFTLVGAIPTPLPTYCLISQDATDIYIITGSETIQKYIVSSGTAGTTYTTGAPATYTTIIQTATDFNQTLYVTLSVNAAITTAFSRIVSINTNTGAVTAVTNNTVWAGGSNNRYFNSIAYVNGKLFFTICDGSFFIKTIRCLTDINFSTTLTNVQRIKSISDILYASNGSSLYSVNTTTGATTFILDAKDTIFDFMLTVNSVFVSYGSHTSFDYVSVSKLTINRYDLTGIFMSSYIIAPGIPSYSFAYFGTRVYTAMGNSTIYSKNVTTVTVPVYSASSGMTLEQSGWIPGFSPNVYLDGTSPYAYKDSYPLTLVKEARLYIGNQLISRISGDYIKTLKDYSTGYENRAGVNIINGMGDTSVKYTQSTTLTTLPFGIKNLPITAVYRQSTQVQVDFNDISSVLNAPKTNPLYLTSSYSITQMSTILSVPTFQAQNIYSYSNTLIITENGPYITFFNMNKNITDSTGYIRRVNVNNIPYSSAIIDGYMYYYNEYYATRMLMSNYLSLTGLPTTSTLPIWAYGNPASYKIMTVLNDVRYIYYVLSVGSEKLTTTGSYATFTSYVNTGSTLYNVALTFYGVTTASTNGAYDEVVNRVSSRGPYPTSGYNTYSYSGYTLYAETTDGTNCYVTARWALNNNPPVERIFGTIVVMKYDTTADFNTRSSYTFTNDFTNIYVPSPTGGVPLRFPVAYPTVSNNTIRAFIDNFNIYCVVTNQTTYVLYNTPTIYIVNIAAFTPSFSPLYIVGGLSSPYLNDGSYIYFSAYNSGVINRFKINTSVEIGSSWDSFDLYANFPNVFSFTAEFIKQLSPGGFDGRYVYYSGTLTGSAASPVILKYDTTKSFTQANSYSSVIKQWKQSGNFVSASGDIIDISFSRYSPNAFIFTKPTSKAQMLVFMNNISDPTNTNQLSDVLQFNTSQLDETYTFTPTVLVEYAYIDIPEQQFMRKNRYNIVYETLQTNIFKIKSGISTLPLRLLNPVKEIYIYSNTYSNINSFQIVFNGDTLLTSDSTLLRSIEPIELSPVTPTYNTYLYDFVFPVNMSRIGTKNIIINQGANTTIVVFAKTLNVLVIKDGLAGVLFNSLEYVV